MITHEIKFLPDEHLLLEKISRGDVSAFTIVFHAYQKKIYSSAHRLLRDDVLAEEVVQESMLKLWMMGKSLTSIQHLESYLMKISRNKAFDLLRSKEIQRKAEENITAEWTEGHNQTEEHILLNETREIVQSGIDLLPAQQKIVYELCHQQGFKYEEAAQQLNLSTETIRSYMRLAQRFLRNYVRTHSNLVVLLTLFKL